MARRVLPWLLVLIGIVVTVVIAGRPHEPGTLDPASSDPSGSKGLVDLLRLRGATVTVTDQVPAAPATPGAPGAGSVVLVLQDDLTNPQRDALLTWVEAGGLLVVADPASSLHSGPSKDGGSQQLASGEVARGACTLTPLADLGPLAVDGGLQFVLAPGMGHCFGDPGFAFVITTAQGDGTVVALGDPGPFENALLGEADNAPLATALLAPRGTGDVVVLQRSRAGAGRRGLLGLVAPGVLQALVQLGVAFVIVALWRARRLGRPVAEPAPTEIEGSELVVAVGSLWQRGHQRAAAADVLRASLRHDLARTYGVPPSASSAELASAVAGRVTASPEVLVDVLAGPPPDDDHSLVALATSIDRIRTEAL